MTIIMCFHLKVVNIPIRLNTLLISICDLNMPRICLAKNVTCRNWPLWLCQQIKGFSHVVEGMDNLFNKNNYLMTSTWKDSKDVPTPNMLPSSSSSSSWLVDVHVSIVRFRVQCKPFPILAIFLRFFYLCNYFI